MRKVNFIRAKIPGLKSGGSQREGTPGLKSGVSQKEKNTDNIVTFAGLFIEKETCTKSGI